MPAARGLMQIGRINVNFTTTTMPSITPTPGSAFCNDLMSFVVQVLNNQTPTPATTIAIGSNGNLLPQSVIFLTSTANLPASGSVYIGSINTTVNYTGILGNTITGCTGGSGTLSLGQTVTYSLPPQGTVFLQDINDGYIPAGGVGALSPSGINTSSVTLNPIWFLGIPNVVAFYIGQEGGADTLHQFKPSQSTNVSYIISQVSTLCSISGPGSFTAANPVNYNVTVLSSHGSQPSEGIVTLTATQAGNHGGLPFVVGTHIPSGGTISFSIPGHTFLVGVNVTLNASYNDNVSECYISSVSNPLVVSPV